MEGRSLYGMVIGAIAPGRAQTARPKPTNEALTFNSDGAQRSKGIHWPEGFHTEQADLFAHNEIVVHASCEKVFANIVDALNRVERDFGELKKLVARVADWERRPAAHEGVASPATVVAAPPPPEPRISATLRGPEPTGPIRKRSLIASWLPPSAFPRDRRTRRIGPQSKARASARNCESRPGSRTARTAAAAPSCPSARSRA